MPFEFFKITAQPPSWILAKPEIASFDPPTSKTPQPNMKWIGRPLAEIWPFEIFPNVRLVGRSVSRSSVGRQYGAVKCRLICHFRGQALLLSVLHVVACDNVRDCVFLKDDLNRVKKGLNSYELNFSLPTNSQYKLTELN